MPDADDARTDQQLVDAVNRGDAQAFEALYRRYRDWVANLAFRFTRDRDLALDVMQDAFIYFLKKFPGFELTAQVKTFLYPTVKHLAIGARQKMQRHNPGDEALPFVAAGGSGGAAGRDGGGRNSGCGGGWDSGGSGGSGGGSGDDSPAALRLRLGQVMQALSDTHREVVLLRFVDELSLQEIADVLAIPVGTVKSRLHHALKALREDERTRKYFEP